jgi:hypothetical protein
MLFRVLGQKCIRQVSWRNQGGEFASNMIQIMMLNVGESSTMAPIMESDESS